MTYWAWSSRPPRIHAWELSRTQIQLAKRDHTTQTTVCGLRGGIGERPTVRPFSEPEQNHCPDCWRKRHPKQTGRWEPALLPSSPYV